MHDEADDVIAGITLEMFAQVTARAVRLGLPVRDVVPDVLGAEVGAVDWAVVSAGWRSRMEGSEAVRARYTAHYARARAVR